MWAKAEAKEDLITAEFVRSVLHYDKDTGIFTWLRRDNHKIWNNIWPGKQAGRVTQRGYVQIGLTPNRYMAHRLAWLYMTGEWPKQQIDHINLVGTDNRWDNLREATCEQNNLNRGKRTDNTSGRKGVCFHKATGKWSAAIAIGGKAIYLGLYDDVEQAAAVYAKASAEHHGVYGRL